MTGCTPLAKNSPDDIRQQPTINNSPINSPVPLPVSDKKVLHHSLAYFKKNLKKEMDVQEITETFGKPEKDIGSGLHIFVYTLDDGSEILLGSTGKELLYAYHEKENLLQ